jgi:hypothetical protein
MNLKFNEPQQKKIVAKALSLDARDIAISLQDEVFVTKKNDNKNRLEINIIEDSEEFQEVEIVYGDKKKRKRIAKLLPKNLANFIYAAIEKPTPSMKVGAFDIANLSKGLQDNQQMFLQEKFLRVLTKINQISKKTCEKIWDSEERINTTEKVVLVAVINCTRPANDCLDRVIVSMRSNEIKDQNSFKKFIAEVFDLTKDAEKLTKVLFGDLSTKLSSDKKSDLVNHLNKIVLEPDNSAHQLKFLQKVVNEISSGQEALRNN